MPESNEGAPSIVSQYLVPKGTSFPMTVEEALFGDKFTQIDLDPGQLKIEEVQYEVLIELIRTLGFRLQGGNNPRVREAISYVVKELAPQFMITMQRGARFHKKRIEELGEGWSFLNYIKTLREISRETGIVETIEGAMLEVEEALDDLRSAVRDYAMYATEEGRRAQMAEAECAVAKEMKQEVEVILEKLVHSRKLVFTNGLSHRDLIAGIQPRYNGLVIQIRNARGDGLAKQIKEAMGEDSPEDIMPIMNIHTTPDPLGNTRELKVINLDEVMAGLRSLGQALEIVISKLKVSRKAAEIKAHENFYSS